MVRAHVDFADGTGWKTRPVVVVRADAFDLEVLPATTSRRGRVLRDHVEVVDLTAAGLLLPTAVCRRPIVIERRDIVEVVGALGHADSQEILSADRDGWFAHAA